MIRQLFKSYLQPLHERIERLEERVFLLENPYQYNVGDKVDIKECFTCKSEIGVITKRNTHIPPLSSQRRKYYMVAIIETGQHKPVGEDSIVNVFNN